MKRGMLGTFAALVVALVVGAGAAGADGGYDLTMHWSPSPITSGSSVTFSGRLTLDGVGVDDVYVEMDEFDTPDCSIDTFWDTSGYGYSYTDVNGNYAIVPDPSYPIVFTGGSGHYYVQVTYFEGDTGIASSACLPLNASSNQVNHEFLCNSKWQVQPGVYAWNDAMALEQQGYWLPTAVDGNIAGGTNLGNYNLQCNVTPKGDGYVGAGGEWWPGDWSAYAAAEGGLYPH